MGRKCIGHWVNGVEVGEKNKKQPHNTKRTQPGNRNRRKEPRQKLVWMKIRGIEGEREDATRISCRSQITWCLRWI